MKTNGNYHVGMSGKSKGKIVPCPAKVKCRLKQESPHFDTKAEGEQWLSEQAQKEHGDFGSVTKKPKMTPGEKACAVIPALHNPLNEDYRSDAFYNTTGTVDNDAIDALATYHHYKAMSNVVDPGERLKVDLQSSLAKMKLTDSEYGKNYKGYEYDIQGADVDGEYTNIRDLEKMGVVSYSPMPEYNSEWDNPQDFPDDDAPRRVDATEDNISKYGHTSREYLKTLTPEEHNAISYWTGCGSSVANSIRYGGTNPWGINNNKDEIGTEEYFDYDNYMKNVDSALDKAELPSETLLYRGVNESYVPKEVADERHEEGERTKTMEWVKNTYKQGESISFDMPQSATYKTTTAYTFSSSTNIIYEIKAKKAAAVGATSAWGFGEGEYIIPRTTKYKVVNVLPKTELLIGSKDNSRDVFIIQLEQE